MASSTLKKKSYEFKLTRVCETGPSGKVDNPEAAYEYWQSSVMSREWFQEQKENLIVLFLNTRYNIEGHNLVAIGSLNESTAHPREILAPVICASCFAFILMHNHPSGDPSPSEADRHLTRRINDVAQIVQIGLLDHVIVGTPSPEREPFFSFKEMGLL
jgi:DNA repair protein RadC